MRGGDVRAWRDREAAERPLRTSWRLFAGSFIAIGVLMVLRLATDRARPLDWLLVALLVVAGLFAVRHQVGVRDLEAGRRTEAEGFARILRGLSRSVSPDAILSAIVGELGEVTGADHVVVVQRSPHGRGLEATLVSSRPGIPSSTTLLPSSDLDDPLSDEVVQPTAVPIEPALAVAAVPVVAGGVRPATLSAGGVAVAHALAIPEAAGPIAFHTAVPRPRVPTRPIERAAAVRVAGRIGDRVRRAYGLTHTVAEPLISDGRVVGALVLSRRLEGEWAPSARRMLAAAAGEASAALERAYSYREVEAAASTDALTGLPNRRYFDEFCGLLARRRRAEDAVGVLMIDIDRFKGLNDRFGHAAGDEVLRAVAGAIGSSVREADVPARYGGEEFAVLLRNPSRRVALDVAERVRSTVSALDVRQLGPVGVTVSVGVAVAELPDEPIAELIERADRALYRAKRAGRDRVIAA